MAEIAEGFSVNATINLDEYASVNVIGDIKLPKTNITKEESTIAASVILDNSDTSHYIGDIRRANTGTQGFTIKAASLLDDIDINLVLADISHGRSVISDQTNDLLVSLLLDDNNVFAYIGDIRRANSGTQGFTIKSTLSVDEIDTTTYFADIAHARCIINDYESELSASLILDVPEDSEILADIRRANNGTQGFTLKAFSMLDNYDEIFDIGDMYRSNSKYSRSTTRIIYYKGKKYLLYQADKLHYVLSELGDGN